MAPSLSHWELLKILHLKGSMHSWCSAFGLWSFEWLNEDQLPYLRRPYIQSIEVNPVSRIESDIQNPPNMQAQRVRSLWQVTSVSAITLGREHYLLVGFAAW